MGKQKTLQFAETSDGISTQDYLDLVNYFDKNLVMGIELERDTRGKDSYFVADKFNTTTEGSIDGYRKSISNLYNVAFVTHDGSVPNGVELIFGGTVQGSKWVHEKLLKIENKLQNLKTVHYSKNTSNHISFVTLQNKLINPVVVKNIFNLTRAFSAPLFWLGCADPTRIHRGMHFCKPLFSITPINKLFSDFKDEIEKFSQCNIGRTQAVDIAGKQMASGLYVEFRHIDGMRVPTAITANGFLLRALVYKALCLSRKGVVKVESIGDWNKNKMVVDRLNDQVFMESDVEYMIKEAHNMIDFMLPELKRLAPDVVDTLYQLADKPVYMRSRRWNTVEKELSIRYNSKITKNEEKLINLVLDADVKAKTAGEWKKKMARKLSVSVRMVEYMIQKLDKKLGLRRDFDKELKQYSVVM